MKRTQDIYDTSKWTAWEAEPFHLIHLHIKEGIRWYNFTRLYKLHRSWREVKNEIIYRIVNFVIVKYLTAERVKNYGTSKSRTLFRR